MNVTEAVKTRQSIRAFLDRPVARTDIEAILEAARCAPSGGNLQPWRAFVLGGDRLREFRQLIASKMLERPMGEGFEYNVYPPNLHEPYRSRRYQCGEDLYASIGITRDDRPARLRQFANNYGFFGAPLGIFFAIDRRMQEGQWADLGMFIQTVMLLAIERGLDTCAQEAWASWHKTVAAFLDMPEELMLFCGMAVGYRDAQHPINGWRTERAPLGDLVEWQGV